MSTAQNALIEAALERWETPLVQIGTPAEVKARCVPVDDISDHQIAAPSYVVAFDGSNQEVEARREYPSVRVGFLQVTGVFVGIDAFLNSRVDGLVDPRKLVAARDAQTLQAVLPSSHVSLPKHSGVDSWRAELYAMFSTQGSRDFGESTFTLIDALMTMHGAPGQPRRSVPLGRCPACSDRQQSVREAPVSCTNCGAELYPTDLLRTHDEYQHEGSNASIITRTMNVAERLLALTYLDGLANHSPMALGAGMFITDGPLAFYGPTAPLKRRMVDYWGELCSGQTARGFGVPMLVGVEKGGAFVDHANAIAEFVPSRNLMVLDNAYIAEKIRMRPSQDVYGVDEFYGRRFFYKTSTDQMIVLTVPRTPAGQPYEATGPDGTNPSEDLASYPSLRATVDALDRLQTRLYPNAVIPVALAHSEASLPLGTGRSVLTLLAQQHLGIPTSTLTAGRAPTEGRSWVH